MKNTFYSLTTACDADECPQVFYFTGLEQAQKHMDELCDYIKKNLSKKGFQEPRCVRNAMSAWITTPQRTYVMLISKVLDEETMRQYSEKL